MTGHAISTSETSAGTDIDIEADHTATSVTDHPAASPQPPTPLLEFLDLGIDTDTDGGGVCDANGVCS